MKQKFTVLFLLFICSSSVFSQTADSLKLIAQFENYALSNNASVQDFKDLFRKHVIDLTVEERIRFATKGAEAAATFKNDSLYVDFYYEVINVYAVELMDVEKTRELLEVIEDKVNTLESDINQGRYNHFMGISYYFEGNFVKALDYYKRAFQYLKEVAPQKAKGSLYNIRNIYSVLGLNEDAIRTCKEGLLLNSHLPQREVYINTAKFTYLINETFSENQSDSTLYYTKKMLDAISKLDTIKSISELSIFCQINLSALRIFLKQGDKSKVDSLLQEVARCKGKIEPYYSFSMADYYLQNKEFDKAASLISEISDTSIFKQSRIVLNKLLGLQFLYEQGVGNYEKALELYMEQMALEIEELDEKQRRYIAFTNAQLNAAEREAEINNLKEVAEAENRKSQLLFFSISLLLFFLLIALFYYRKTKQNNDLLKSDLENKKIIETQAEELKRVDALKSKLFSNISHELRTPLTLIAEPIKHILRNVPLADNYKNQLILARKSSQQLLSISNQIMDLTKTEIGKIKANPVRFHWNDFLKNLLPTFELIAKNKGLYFSETKHYNEPILIQSDVIKLKIILNNLLQNAFKFSQAGGAILLDSKDKGEFFEFSVKDTGIGIDETELPLVFNRYYQSKNRVEAEGGFGIGLAVCQEYIKLLGGTIKIESELGAGTTVTINLPKIIGEADSAVVHSFEEVPTLTTLISVPASEDIDDTDAAHLLIVEDNADLREFLKNILSEAYTLSFAFNGVEALRKLEEHTPSLIITDWMMPIMNGLELVKKLKANPKLRSIPVLMLTARSLSIDQLKAFQKGVDDYLLKPFETEFLKLRIEHLLDFSQGRQEDNLSNNPKIIGLVNHKSNNDDSVNFNIQNPKDLEWIRHLEELVQEQMSDFDFVLDKLYSEMGLGKTQFYQKVKAVTGLSPKQFINEIRFWEARRLLEEKEVLSVKAVAYSIGFKSVKNFSRNFKKRFGMYPSELLRDLGKGSFTDSE